MIRETDAEYLADVELWIAEGCPVIRETDAEYLADAELWIAEEIARMGGLLSMDPYLDEDGAITYEPGDGWEWDISRPLAEQLAETAADDAAADALPHDHLVAGGARRLP